jgi:iron(III) transport system permease protein
MPAEGPLVFLIAFFALGYILYPLVSLFEMSVRNGLGAFSFAPYAGLLQRSAIDATVNSVLVSLLSVVGSLLLGTFLAYVFHYFDFPFKRFFSRLIILPIALPPLVGVISFLFLIGDGGMITRLLASLFGVSPSTFAVKGWAGILLVHIYSFYVYFYLFVSDGLSQLDENVLEASLVLGASRLTTTRRVLLPMLSPSLVAGSLITFMASMASFTAPFLFGGTSRFLTLEIYISKLNGDDTYSAVLSVFLAAISICFLFILRWYQRRRKLTGERKGVSRKISVPHHKVTRTVGISLAVFCAVIFSLPVLMILLMSVVKDGTWTVQVFPTSFTLDNYLSLLTSINTFGPFINSLEMAAIATTAAIVIGVGASYIFSRTKFFGNGFLDIVFSLPFGIPGTVVAVALILSFNTPTLFSMQSVLVGTFWIVPLAYLIRELPILIRSVTAGFEGMDWSVEEAASTLGSKQSRTFRKIIAPLILPSVISGALIVFINSAGEFVSSILLYSYSTKPISVDIFSQLRLYNIGAAAAEGVLLMVLVVIVIAFSKRISSEGSFTG